MIPDGELYSARLGNQINGSETEMLRYTYIVDDNSGFLYYKYAIVFQNPEHPNAPKLIINTIVNGQYQDCESYQVDANVDVQANPNFHYGTSGVKWKEWTTVGIDLSNYSVGDEIVFEFENYDCGAGGHFGYTYLVAGYKEEPISHEPCGDDGNYYLFAPEGYTYLWNTAETTQYIALENPNPGTTYSCQLTLNIENTVCDALIIETIIKDYDCCKTQDQGIDITPFGVAGNIGYTTQLPDLIFGQTLYINGTLYVNDDLEVQECVINFGPNGKIVILPNVIFGDKENSVFKPCNNSFMWDGIYDTSSPVNLMSSSKFNSSKFISAKSALNYQKYNRIWVHEAQFKNCHTAMELNNYNLDINNYPSNTVIFVESEVYGGPLNEVYLGANNSTNGIILNNCQNVPIGFHDNGIGQPIIDLNDLNEFVNLRTGIQSYNSSLNIKYSHFYDPYTSTSRAINSQSISTNASYTSGIDAAHCVFTDYYKGIYQYGPVKQKTIVWDNEFRGNHKGIESICLGAYFSDDGSLIRRNNFHDTTYGVEVSGYNDYGALVIAGNSFFNSLKKSIWVRNIDSYFFPSNFQFPGAYGVEIHNNFIKYDTNVGSSNINGITVSNCQGVSGPRIYYNSLTYYARPTLANSHKYKGIVIKDVINGSVYDNNLVAWGEGIRALGHNEILSFKCNDFLDCYKGFRFSTGLSGSVSYISQQGLVNRPHNNYFYGEVEERFSGNLSMPNYIDWWSNPSSLTNIYLTQSLFAYIYPMYTTSPSACISFEPRPSIGDINPELPPGDPETDTGDTGDKMAVLLNYNETYMNNQGLDTSVYRNKYLYSLVELQLETQDAGEIELLSNIYNILLESNIAKMVGIEKDISARAFNAALEKNDAFIANTLTEMVNKEVYNIWLNTIAKDIHEFTEAQENTLLDYALLTPYYGGEAVYLARIMLGIDIDDYGIEYRMAEENIESVVENPWNVFLINNMLNISPQQTAKGLILYDITGREVFKTSQELPVGGQSVIILPSLPKGVYIYSILNKNEETVYTNKLFIH